MPAIREAVIVKTTECEMSTDFVSRVDGLPGIAPGGSLDAVVEVLRVVVGDTLIEIDLAEILHPNVPTPNMPPVVGKKLV
jgi:hypothetical protein